MLQTKSFLSKFLLGCLIGFLTLILSKLMMELVYQEPVNLTFDWFFIILIGIGGLAFTLINKSKKGNS